MPDFSIVYADAAKDDLADIAGYIDEKAGAVVAARFVDGIIATVETLSRMPHRHREGYELGVGTRVIGFRRYLNLLPDRRRCGLDHSGIARRSEHYRQAVVRLAFAGWGDGWR